jgi:hypothetical protein
MKTSNKMLFIAACCLLALISVSVLALRLAFRGPLFEGEKATRQISPAEHTSTQTYAFTDFDELDIDGSWQFIISQGDTYQLTVKGSAELIDALDINKTGKTLHLAPRTPYPGSSSAQLTAAISLPVLNLIRVGGASRIKLKDFTTDKLILNFAGAGQLQGANNRISQLVLDCSGAADVDLDQSTVNDAKLNISGAARIKLNMAGGMLTGTLSGLASVVYRGTVAGEKIATSGLAKVTRQE